MRKKRLLSCLLSIAFLLSYLTVFPQTDAKAANNLATGKSLTSSWPVTGIQKATDGIISTTNYTESAGQGSQWIQVDLGNSYDISSIKLWHYFADGRIYRDVIVQLSNDPNFVNPATVYNNDTDASSVLSRMSGSGAGKNSEYAETSAGLTINFSTVNARYARFYSSGSNVNNYNHYSEIEIYESQITGSLVNLAAGKPIATSSQFSNTSKINDGNRTVSNYADSSPANGLQWVQVDLLQSCFIDTIKLWHYYGDARTYHDVIVQISDDPSFSTGVQTLYNNDDNNSSGLNPAFYLSPEYSEKASGLTVSGKMYGFFQRARYVRFYSNGNTVNSANHYSEIEIYGYTSDPAIGNLAAGRPVFYSTPFTNSSYITDVDTSTSNFSDSYDLLSGRGNGLQYVQLDLCLQYDIDSIKLWHYYSDGRKYHDVIVQLSNDPAFKTGVTTVFNNDTDNYACLGAGKDSEYAETSAGLNLSFAPVNARYVRFYSNGSTSNKSNHYVDVQVYGKYAEHVPGNIIDGMKPSNLSSTFNNASYITDGVKRTSSFFSDSSPNSGLQWIQMDLSNPRSVNEIRLWHYYGDYRKYHDVIVQLSNDPTFTNGVTTVYNNDTDNSAKLGAGNDIEYTETSSGLDIKFDPVSARYARFYSSGSTANSYNHYVEIEMYQSAEVVHPTTVNLNKASDTIDIGSSDIFTATVLPTNSSNKNVTWSSDSPDVASVSQTGTVTGLKAGTAVITSTTADGSLTSSCVVTVVAPVVHPASISLDVPSTDVPIHPGGNYQLNATVLPADATNKNVIWSSSDTTKAAVTQTGLVTGVSEGLVTIWARTEDGGLYSIGHFLVTSQPIHPSSVTLDKSKIKLLAGQNAVLTAAIYPSTADDKSIVWASSNPNAATVSQDGLVTGLAYGGSEITATTVDGKLVAKCFVDVSLPQPQGNLLAGASLSTLYSFTSNLYATDRDISTDKYANGIGGGLQWVQYDLGVEQDINQINLWHYFGDGRTYHDVIVQLSSDPTFATGVKTVFSNDTDNSAGRGAGSDLEYVETAAGKSISFGTAKARYVRLYSNGSTVNRYNHYVEVEVCNNLAAGKLPVSSAFSNAEYMSDSYKGTDKYAEGSASLQWIQYDLGESRDLNEINLWHYFGDGRKYHDVIVQISDNPDFTTGITTVFNNDTDNSAGKGFGADAEYAETSAGKKISFDTKKARYVRIYSNGSTANAWNHYVEIEVCNNYIVEDAPQVSPLFTNMNYIKDGDKSTNKYSEGLMPGSQFIQVDLGDSFSINNIKLWHYFGDSRTYHDVIVQISDDPAFTSLYTTVYNNDRDNSAKLGAGTDSEYVETSSGLDIKFPTVKGRYVRFISNGSTANSYNHYVEIEMYFDSTLGY